VTYPGALDPALPSLVPRPPQISPELAGVARRLSPELIDLVARLFDPLPDVFNGTAHVFRPIHPLKATTAPPPGASPCGWMQAHPCDGPELGPRPARYRGAQMWNQGRR
jgi:hypothetical protein